MRDKCIKWRHLVLDDDGISCRIRTHTHTCVCSLYTHIVDNFSKKRRRIKCTFSSSLSLSLYFYPPLPILSLYLYIGIENILEYLLSTLAKVTRSVQSLLRVAVCLFIPLVADNVK